MPSHVLITIEADGTVDFCSDGDVQTVLVDYRLLVDTEGFPDVVEAVARRVRATPITMPWRQATLLELKRISKAQRELLIALIPAEESELTDAG